MQRASILLLWLMIWFNVSAGLKTKKVTAEYIYHIPENVAPEAARETAVQRAMAQAIADEFGMYVSQSSTTYIETSEEHTNTDFLSIGGSELKGEWIETIGEPKFEYFTDGNNISLRVQIKGIIREIDNAKIPFDVKILRNGTDDINESDVFKNGDDLYIAFRTPSSGYLVVYLIDGNKQSYCLLPYQNMENGYFNISANRRYVFFNPEYADGLNKRAVDEIIVETNLAKEQNRILTIFSPNKFYKATDNLTQNDLPRNLTYAEFQKWLSAVKKKDPELSIVENVITIHKE